MLDTQKTLGLIKGGMLLPYQTWAAYHVANPDWKETVQLLTGPLLVGSVAVGYVLSLLFQRNYTFGPAGSGPLGLVIGLLFAAFGIFVVSFVFSYLASIFQGEHNFDRGLAAVSLAAIPVYIGNALGVLPWFGWLLSLGLSLMGVVFLFQIIPSYLRVPDDKRVLHFVMSILVSMFVMSIFSSMLAVEPMTRG